MGQKRKRGRLTFLDQLRKTVGEMEDERIKLEDTILALYEVIRFIKIKNENKDTRQEG